MADNFPEMIGKYKIEGIVAKGGMGVVYKSTHPTLKRPVIIKKLTKRRGNHENHRTAENDAAGFSRQSGLYCFFAGV